MKIQDLGPSNADHSTGLILRWRDRLLFALEDRRNWRDRGDEQIAKLIGIGGHVEVGETWTQAVRREAQEEAGLEVTLIEPERTLFFDSEGPARDISAQLDCPPPRPLFIWSAVFRFGRPPREKSPHFVNPVFLAAAPDDVEPDPGMEVPGILGLSKAQLERASKCPTTLGDLLADGALFWSAQAVTPETWIEPAGSAWWYGVYLRSI